MRRVTLGKLGWPRQTTNLKDPKPWSVPGLPIYAAYATGAYSYREIAEYYGLHLATVGLVIRGRSYNARTNPILVTPFSGK